MKRSNAGSLAAFSRRMRNPVEGSGRRNKQFLHMTTSSGAVVDVAQDDMLHMHKRHPEMTDTDFSVIQENMENFLRVHQDKTEKGDYGGETVLGKIKTSRGITGVSYEFLPTGRIFLKTAFFDHENGIDSWIAKNGTSRDLMDSGITKRGNAASMLTGHPSQTDKTADSPTLSDIQPLSLSMIQERISIVNGASFDKFNQRMNNMRKGSITPQASGRRVISLLEQADESTFLHEMGHIFLMDLENIASLDEASAEDLETVRDWATWQEEQAKEYEDTPWQKEFAEREKAILAAKKHGDVVEVRKLKREWEQECFARGFERYLETGKAPTSVLKRIFLKFKKS